MTQGILMPSPRAVHIEELAFDYGTGYAVFVTYRTQGPTFVAQARTKNLRSVLPSEWPRMRMRLAKEAYDALCAQVAEHRRCVEAIPND